MPTTIQALPANRLPQNLFTSPLVNEKGIITSQVWLKFIQGLYNAALLPASLQPPPTSTSPGTAGQCATDGNYFYVCIAKDQWKRSALVAF